MTAPTNRIRQPEGRISVIIATYSRAALLDECLHHLAQQAFQTGDEVIVVDNGSKDRTGDIVTAWQERFPVTLRLLYEETPGKSHALACALKVAAGEVLAFLDDDINADPNWLGVVRDTMRDPDIALMGGRVVARWEASVPAWMRVAPADHARLGAPLGLLDYPPDVVVLGARTVLGGNMAVRREVFETVGGFATHLGKLRGTLLSGEDHELCQRVQRAGFRAVYVPAAVVHHWVPADRARVRYFVNWFYWSGITNAILDEDGHVARGRAVAGLPLYLARRALMAAVAAGGAMLRGRRARALHHATDVAFAAGYAAKRWGLHS
jgi:glycosyltransferase involved in cell wall biosynthesis